MPFAGIAASAAAVIQAPSGPHVDWRVLVTLAGGCCRLERGEQRRRQLETVFAGADPRRRP